MGSRNYNLTILKNWGKKEKNYDQVTCLPPYDPAEKWQMAGAAVPYYEDDN